MPALRQLQGPASLDPRAINRRRASGAGHSTLDDDPIEDSPVRPTTPRAAAADRQKRLKDKGWDEHKIWQPNATWRHRNPMPVLIVSRKELDEGESGAQGIKCWGKRAPSMKEAADLLSRTPHEIRMQLRMLLSEQRRTRWSHEGELIYVLHEDVTEPVYGRLQFVQAARQSAPVEPPEPTPKRRRSTRHSPNKASWPSWDKAGTPGDIPRQSTT